MKIKIYFLSTIIAIIIFLHHFLIHGYLLDIEDINNHETIALFFIGIAVGSYIQEKLCNMKL